MINTRLSFQTLLTMLPPLSEFFFFFHNFLFRLFLVTDCTYEYTSAQQKNGTFTSPAYPEPYSTNTVCRYNFQGQGKERVQIIFMDLDLHYPAGDPKDPYE